MFGLSTSRELEPISWPLKVASAMAFPISTFLIFAFPLAIYYSFSYNDYNSQATGVIVEKGNPKSDNCVSRIDFIAGDKVYSAMGDCINNKVGQEKTVYYKAGDPAKNTVRGPLFSYVFIPLFGGFLTLFGLWIFMNCFKFYRDLFVYNAWTRQALEDKRTKDIVYNEYNEDDWYAQQELEEQLMLASQGGESSEGSSENS